MMVRVRVRVRVSVRARARMRVRARVSPTLERFDSFEPLETTCRLAGPAVAGVGGGPRRTAAAVSWGSG